MDYNKCMPKVDPLVKKVLEALEGLSEDTPSGIWLSDLPGSISITNCHFENNANDGIIIPAENDNVRGNYFGKKD